MKDYYKLTWKMKDPDEKFEPCKHKEKNIVAEAKFCPICGASLKSLDWRVYQYLEQMGQFLDGIDTNGRSVGYATHWVNFDRVFLRMSKRFSQVIFMLDIFSERNNGDGGFWRHYYLNGQTYQVSGKVVFPEFSEGSLCEPQEKL